MNIERLTFSESTRRRNPELFGVGGLRAPEPQPGGQRTVAPADAPETPGAGGVVISLVGFRRRLLDDDNFSGACKWLRDAIAASLGRDDGDQRIHWQYAQCHTTGKEGVLVRIENDAISDAERKL